MRWENRRRSSNVEDRRGQRSSRLGVGGVGGSSAIVRLLPMLISKLGIKGVLLIAVGVFALSKMGVDIPALLLGQPMSQQSGPKTFSPEEQRLCRS